MRHARFEYRMHAPAAVVFDAFHFHRWRACWDSLVGATHVVGGADCPSIGAETVNTGRGVLRQLTMRTRFVSFDRPRLAAARMVGRSFPFTRWAASMRHHALGPDASLLTYTYTLEAGPRWLHWLVEPVVQRAFDAQTHRRFARLQAFVACHRAEVEAWQRERQERP
jgi:hypothetical protein